MEAIHFTSTRLKDMGKQGILPADEDGYYSILLGGLNVYNSAGIFYTAKHSKELFESSSILMRRIQNGCVKAEVGHPKFTEGMSKQGFFNRIKVIEETNVCAHISEVWLDYNVGDISNIGNGADAVIKVWGKVKPAGPHAVALQSAFDNKKENVCFSIRSLATQTGRVGNYVRTIDTIITFDWVNEPGIKSSSKWSTPTLESLVDVEFNDGHIVTSLESLDGVGMEDSGLQEELLKMVNKGSKRPGKISLKW